jgi:CrcB protein
LLKAIIAISVGAAAGALLRWALGLRLNSLLPSIPPGTLAANLVGGLLMGIAMELATRHTLLSPEMRLLITTGFLGGLTTFSTFSAEITTMLLRRELVWAALGTAAHVAGSVVLTIAGILLARALFAWSAG